MEPWQYGVSLTVGVILVTWCIRVDRLLANLKYMHDNADKYPFGTVEQTKILSEVSKTLLEINSSLHKMATLQNQQIRMLMYINGQMGHADPPPVMDPNHG